MTFSIEVVISAAVILAGIAGAWGDLRARLSRIEKMVGNGHDSEFLRKDSAEFLVSDAHHVHEAMMERIERLERRIDDQH